jgi:protein-tyrosine phosphatase
MLTAVLKPTRPPGSDKVYPIHTIVQLTPNRENGIIKAHPYFPRTVGGKQTLEPEVGATAPDIEVLVKERVELREIGCIKTTLAVRFVSSESFDTTICHLMYSAWPDHGIPDDSTSLLQFTRYVASIDSNPDSATLVGCSAGVGRTGAFIAISSLLRAHSLLGLAETAVSSEVDEYSEPPPLGEMPGEWSGDLVVREIDYLREQRSGMVQRPEQMELVYEVVKAAFEAG